jgi:alkylation response protein AidB-like acyl-CoA dehydrogenase
MNLELTAEQEEFRKIVRAFAEEVVAPRAEAMDREARLDPAVLDQMAGMGLFGLPFPEEVGGMGAD